MEHTDGLERRHSQHQNSRHGGHVAVQLTLIGIGLFTIPITIGYALHNWSLLWIILGLLVFCTSPLWFKWATLKDMLLTLRDWNAEKEAKASPQFILTELVNNTKLGNDLEYINVNSQINFRLSQINFRCMDTAKM